MKFIAFLLLLATGVIPRSSNAQSSLNDPNLRLWYPRPAAFWEEALPLGNGKTGAMAYGGISRERYQLNDNTLWSGYPEAGNNPGAAALLPLVREQIFKANYDSAGKIWKRMQGPYTARYLPLGDLHLNFGGDTAVAEYRRELDLNKSVSVVQYRKGTSINRRETFISYPDQVMVSKISTQDPDGLDFKLQLTSKLHYKVAKNKNAYLVLHGKAPKYVANRDFERPQIIYEDFAGGEGMTFEVHVQVSVEGGKILTSDSVISVSGARTATIYLTTATSFNGFDKSPTRQGKNPNVEASVNMSKALSKGFAILMQRHLSDYQQLFGRVHLKLPVDTVKVKLPTDQRLKQFYADPTDHQLPVLYYQFGRYLMIAASRPGSRPSNLQGIWNDQVQPPWGSNYTTNINTEMNYWPAENTNLSECHQPLFRFLEELAVNGKVTAAVNYNIKDGWTTHHNTDLWAKTSPPGGYEWDPRSTPRWSCWPMAGAWLSTHLWEHYLYTKDKNFLKKYYPVMKGAAAFMLNWLVEDPQTKYLVTNPSTSPENTMKVNGKEYDLSMASTMDMSIIRELFSAVIQADSILSHKDNFRSSIGKAQARLYPFHIGRRGQIQEWFEDWDDEKDKHRHISHLFGLFPGNQINPLQDPELSAASNRTLIERGDESTGWSMAWKINWWARLFDGDHAYKILKDAFRFIDPDRTKPAMSGGGTYPNLFDAHPPFQIDGNFGATAGITEMLMQSHTGSIDILPALPKAWPLGSIEGIKARGNFVINISWREGRLVTAEITPNETGFCSVSYKEPIEVADTKFTIENEKTARPLNRALFINRATEPAAPLNAKRYTITFRAEKGKNYKILPKTP